MIVSAWILFSFFGFLSLVFTLSLFSTSTKTINGRIYFFCIFITAISAGVIWGGLFQ